jgi:hypothetical protein
MRSLGGTFPSRPNAEAGTMYGTVARAAARFKNVRRVRFKFFFNMAVSYILDSCLYLELPIVPAQLSRHIGTEPDFQIEY